MIEIHIEPTKMTKRGQLYQTRIGAPDGTTMVKDTLVPVTSTCRALERRGFSGPFMCYKGGHATMTGIVERAAKVIAVERKSGSLVFRRFKEFMHQ